MSRKDGLLSLVYENKFIYISLAPIFALLIIFNYYPAINAFYYSLFEWDGVRYERFVGFANFVELFDDSIFRASLKNVAIITTARVIITVTFPLLAAELTFNLRNLRIQYLYRIMFIIPMVVPGVVVFLLWGFIYRPDGLLNTILRVLQLDRLTRSWLGDFNTALPAVVFIGFPWVGTFSYLVYLAGLQAIPKNLFEASTLDGASRIQQIFSIDIPLIVGQMKLMVILTIIGVIQTYTAQLILTKGGPGNATMVPGYHMYMNAFYYSKMGYGCAIGTILFVIIFTLTVIARKYIRSSVEFEAK